VLAVAPRRPPALLLACGAEERLGQQGEAMAAGGGAQHQRRQRQLREHVRHAVLAQRREQRRPIAAS
jgi:hypothetical protein